MANIIDTFFKLFCTVKDKLHLVLLDASYFS